ncbi:hypothetical protein [Catenovulum sediminis]|uniref:Uncharacterized protein n=1 Tax=Catenovulum sediminis TaxID=1740262 RepID=A0ABV1RCR2_9ALTE
MNNYTLAKYTVGLVTLALSLLLILNSNELKFYIVGAVGLISSGLFFVASNFSFNGCYRYAKYFLWVQFILFYLLVIYSLVGKSLSLGAFFLFLAAVSGYILHSTLKMLETDTDS